MTVTSLGPVCRCRRLCPGPHRRAAVVGAAMSADLLRRAARMLREQGEAATPGPWSRYGNLGFAVFSEVVFEDADYEPPSVTVGSEIAADAEFITLMHPPVALALAASLDSTADSHDDVGLPLADEVFVHEVALARAILREAS